MGDRSARGAWKRKLALLPAGCLIAVFLLEAFGPIVDQEDWNINRTNIHVRFRTSEFDTRVTTNSQGLREPQSIPADHLRRFRIIIIGDSYTFGWGVDDSQPYPKVAERKLLEVPGNVRPEVINMGRPGSSPGDYLRFLKQYASRLKPDLIVIGYHVGNDCPLFNLLHQDSDCSVYSHPELLGAQQAQDLTDLYVKLANQGHIHGGILWHSFVFRTLYKRLYRPWKDGRFTLQDAGMRGAVMDEANPLSPPILDCAMKHCSDPSGARSRYEKLRHDGWIDQGLRQEISPWLLNDAIFSPDFGDTFFLNPGTVAAMQSQWTACERVLLEIKKSAQALNSNLVIYIIPQAAQVDSAHFQFLKQLGFHVPNEVLASRKANDIVVDFCKRNDIPYVDPLVRLRSEADMGQHLFYRMDGHPNAKGCEVLGEFLAEELRKSGIVPR